MQNSDPCARQLAAGFRNLRFAPDLEAEYRAFHETEQKWVAYGSALFAMAVLLFFCIRDFIRLDLTAQFPDMPLDIWALQIIRYLALTALALRLLWPSAFAHRFDAHSAVLVLLLGLNITVGFIALMPRGMTSIDFGQLLMMGVFLLLGMRFWWALSAAIAFVAIHLGAIEIWLDPSHRSDYQWRLAMMLLAAAAGGVGGYLREKTSRRHFLTSHIAEHLASHDSLTGLPNRRSFESRVQALLATRPAQRLLLALIDIDHFKRYNDCFGHAGGDAALRLVARRLVAAADGPAEFAARVGGEEFAVVLVVRDTTDGHARLQALLDAIRRIDPRSEAVADTPVPDDAAPTVAMREHGTLPWLTASIGATLSQASDTLDALYRRADRHLYRSKQGGRDQLTDDESDAAPQPVLGLKTETANRSSPCMAGLPAAAPAGPGLASASVHQIARILDACGPLRP